MEAILLKTALTIIFIIVCIALIFLILSQEGKDNNISNTLSGSTDSYWSKNKGRSRDAVLAKITAVLVVLFFILAIVISSKWV